MSRLLPEKNIKVEILRFNGYIITSDEEKVWQYWKNTRIIFFMQLGFSSVTLLRTR
jgi:hypothetical protein